MRTTLLALSAIVIVACGGGSEPASSPAAPTSASASVATAAGPERVDGVRAHELVKTGAQLVDVRSPDEYGTKHIDGAINVPVDQVSSHDFGGKDKPLVLYCRAGHRSQQAAEQLQKDGYTKVYLLGPMDAWERK